MNDAIYPKRGLMVFVICGYKILIDKHVMKLTIDLEIWRQVEHQSSKTKIEYLEVKD